MSRRLVILLQHGGWADRYQAATLAATAAALGDPVTLALFFEPLRLWAEDRFDEGAPAEAAAARVAPLRGTIEDARRELGLEVVACETAVRVAGLDPEALRPSLDRYVTLPSLWRAAQDGRPVVI